MLAYFGVILLVIFNRPRGILFDGSLGDYIIQYSNLIPFKSISFYIGTLIDGSINTNISVSNLLLVPTLVMPIGFLVPFIIRKAKKYGTFVIIICGFMLVAETLQMLLKVGIFDIDDVILGLVGATVGYALHIIICKIVGKIKASIPALR